MLFDQAKVSILAVQSAVLIFSYIIWGHTDTAFLAAWTIVFSVINAARYALVFAFERSPSKEILYPQWKNAFLVSLFISGCMWGLFAIVALPSEHIFFTAFTVMVITGLIGGAVSTYAISRIAYIIYSTTSAFPLIVILMMQPDTAHQGFALTITVYYGFMLVSMLRLNKMVEQSVQLQFDNLDLLYQLGREKNHVEETNRTLELDIENRKAIEQRLMEEKIEAEVKIHQFTKLSVEDGLTKVMNRRGFNESFEQHWNQAIKYQDSLSLIMLDIDYFKNFNDYYGHPRGDEVLYKIAKTCTANVRKEMDLVTRYGGEEFVVILPKTGLNQACAVAQKLRTGLASLGIPHAESKVAKIVSASFGIASMIPQQTLKSADLLELVDQALYSAKSNGRNCVYPCDPLKPER